MHCLHPQVNTGHIFNSHQTFINPVIRKEFVGIINLNNGGSDATSKVGRNVKSAQKDEGGTSTGKKKDQDASTTSC